MNKLLLLSMLLLIGCDSSVTSKRYYVILTPRLDICENASYNNCGIYLQNCESGMQYACVNNVIITKDRNSIK